MAALEELESKAAQVAGRIEALETGDGDQGAELKKLEAAAAECRKKMLAVQSEIDSNRNLIEEEESAIVQCDREVEGKKEELVGLVKRREKIAEDLAVAEAKKATLEDDVLKAQQAMAVIVTGVGGRDNADVSFFVFYRESAHWTLRQTIRDLGSLHSYGSRFFWSYARILVRVRAYVYSGGYVRTYTRIEQKNGF